MSERKRKIYVCASSLGIGGVEKALLGLINSFDYDKVDVDLQLASYEGEYIKYLNPRVNLLPEQDVFSWVFLPKKDVLRCILKLLKQPLMLFFFIKNILWGLFHKNMAQARQRMWRNAIGYVPKLNGKYDEALDFSGLFRRYVLTCVDAKQKHTWIHSDYNVFGYDKEIDYDLLRQFDSINCVSETCKVIFDKTFSMLIGKSRVCQNIVDMGLIKSQLKGKSFDDGFAGIRLLDVTRIDPNKGLDLAVKVCSMLKKQGVNFRWYILGNDPLGYRKELERLIQLYDVVDSFILLGFTSNPYPYMNDADIIVHFSRFEGRSVSIDEALALRKPILLTNYPTAKDQITNGVNGWICEFDENKLCEKLVELINKRVQDEKN